jgi:hypothetical protein
MIRTVIACAVLLFVGVTVVSADTVSGTVQYENRIYNTGGFTGSTEMLPVRQADVEVIRSSDSAVLGSGQTDDNGAYSISVTNGGSQTIFLRIYARQTDGQINVTVRDNATSNQIYVADTTAAAEDTDNPVVINASITLASGVAGPFNIFDVSVFGFEYLATVDTDFPASPEGLTVYWQSGSTNGTFYDRTSNEMALLGTTSDPDEFDDDIILHEFGHYVEDTLGDTDTPGGSHSLTDILDIRLAWSEGWSHYFSSAVRRWVETNDPGRYPLFENQIDNRSSSASFFDLQAPSFSASTITAANEVAVAAVLWDLLDSADEGHDVIAGTDVKVWLPFNDGLPGRAHISLEDYFDEYIADNPLETADVLTLFAERTIRYSPDAQESDDSNLTATAMTPGTTSSTHTMFGVGDEDWFAIPVESGSTYTVETVNLGDGCDTVLYVYRNNGTTLVDSNDDRDQAGGDFGSIVSFVADETSTWFARVDRFDGVDAVGTYGFYDFTFVRNATGTNSAPTVTASVSDSSGGTPHAVTFSMTASDSDGSIVRYEWDFDGDGVYDADSASSGTAYHTFGLPGTYSAVARVTDDDGDSGVDTVTVTVTAVSGGPVITSVSASTSGSVAPVTATFSATVAAGDSELREYLWDFDSDGNWDFSSTSTPNTSFVYREAGTFTARLVVVDGAGLIVADTVAPITVTAGVCAPAARHADGLRHHSARRGRCQLQCIGERPGWEYCPIRMGFRRRRTDGPGDHLRGCHGYGLCRGRHVDRIGDGAR